MLVTEEELGEWKETKHIRDFAEGSGEDCESCQVTWPCDAARLIEAHREALGLLRTEQRTHNLNRLGPEGPCDCDTCRFLAPPQPEA